MQTIRNLYIARHPVDIELRLDDQTPASNVPLADINFYRDNLVIFRAVEIEAKVFRTTPSQAASSNVSPLRSEGLNVPVRTSRNPTPSYPSKTGEPLSSTRSQELVAPATSRTSDSVLQNHAVPSKIPQSMGRVSPPPSGQIDVAGTQCGQHSATPSAQKNCSTYGTPPLSTPPLSTPPPFIPSASVETNTRESPTDSDNRDLSNKSKENLYLQELLNRDANLSVETLEAALSKGTQLLDALKPPFINRSSISSDARYWAEQISNLRGQAGCAKTVIGVVGDTGAGKSTVINSILDEERLVPTNCMRACTAVVTEISYNENADDSVRYRAEIEFIKQEDWAKELSILFHDLLDQSGNVSRETQQHDSEAGIAYAKIKAVYPHKTKDELESIASSGWETLLRDPLVQSVLGTTRSIEASESESFYGRLQRYVDSKEKSTNDKSKGQRKEKKKMEYWPLIKVVRIFTKAPVLSTGAVVVDLPGVHDSNAARAAVCEGYMKQCNGLWIVAPIIRAIDNKAAKELLGASFKRQLKYDGTYGNITFICSKTDDISTTEAYHAFNLDETMLDSWDRATQLEKQIEDAKTELDEFRRTQTCYVDAVDDIEDQIDRWEARQKTLESGEMVYASPTKDKKRKRDARSGKRSRDAVKRLKAENSSADELSDEDSDSGTDDDSQKEPLGDPLTDAEVNDKLGELKDMRKEARKRRQEAGKQAAKARQKVEELVKEKTTYDSKVRAACIAERNRWSKQEIQQDFASGIKELDQENAAEEDEANFNPDEDIRDYEEVARSLPVFCISSRAYQKLCGRLKKDSDVAGFTELAQTEVPQLKAHCIKLTEANRADGGRKFLNSLSQLLNSLSLWSSNKEDGVKLSDVERDAEGRQLERQLRDLSESLMRCADDCIHRIKSLLTDHIFGRFQVAIDAAVRCASPTVERWGQKPNHDDCKLGGYPWATYKALCRRNGVFANARGQHDWNEKRRKTFELPYRSTQTDALLVTDPMMRALMSGWEKAFQRRLPHALKQFASTASNVISNFHVAVVQRARDTGIGLATIGTLAQQLRTYEASFDSIAGQLTMAINEQQKEANRQFTPMITGALGTAYEWCTNESGMPFTVKALICGTATDTEASGPGSFKRMKDIMEQNVNEHKAQMFGHAAAVVQRDLDVMCANAERQLKHGVRHVHSLLSRDYAQVIRGSNIGLGSAPPTWEVEAKKEILRLIDNSEKGWEDLLRSRDGASMPANGFGDVSNSKQDVEDNDSYIADLNAHLSTAPIRDDDMDWSNDETMVEDKVDCRNKLQDVVDGGKDFVGLANG